MVVGKGISWKFPVTSSVGLCTVEALVAPATTTMYMSGGGANNGAAALFKQQSKYFYDMKNQ